MYNLSQADINAFQDAYGERTRKSKLYGQNYKYLADSRSTAGMNPNMKEVVYQIAARTGKGTHFTDIDGNEYLDIIMGFGVLLCGHNPDFVGQAIINQIQNEGLQLGPRYYLSGPVAELLCEMARMDRAAFYSTGTEANMMAVRLARKARKGQKLVMFRHSYHGHHEDLCPMHKDFPSERTFLLEYGAEQSLDIIRTNSDDIAAVIIEPVQSQNLSLQPKTFVKQLRQLTNECDIPLIFDEVLSGFRIHQGGAQAWYDVRADIATYGKVVGGGYPIGAVAGSSRYMDLIDGGTKWQFGNDSYPEEERAFSMGTFNQNPHCMTAAHAMMSYLKEQGPALQNDLTIRVESTFEILNHFFTENGYPIKIDNFGAQFRFRAKANRNLDLFYHHLIHQGIYVWEMRNLFFSVAHTEKDLEQFRNAVMETVAHIFKKKNKIPQEATS